MKTLRIVGFTVSIITFQIVTAYASNASRWQAIELGRLDSLIVRFIFLPEATLADELWIGFELENTGDLPIRLLSTEYSIGYRLFNRHTGRQTRSVSGALLHTHKLFPSNCSLQPGVHRVVRQPSSSISVMLGMPPREGVWGELQTSMTIELEKVSQRHQPSEQPAWFRMSMEKRNIRIEWPFPNEADLAQMRTRLQNLLKHPQQQTEQRALLRLFLKIPSLIQELTVEELLEGVELRDFQTRSVNGRQEIWDVIENYHHDALLVQQHIIHRLNAYDITAGQESYNVWTNKFIDPLLTIYTTTRQTEDMLQVLETLAFHQQDWADNVVMTKQLSARLLQEFGNILLQSPQTMEENDFQQWAKYAKHIGDTHDTQLISLLQPFLDSKYIIRPVTLHETPVPYSSIYQTVRGAGDFPCVRVCDVALHGILTLLDGDVNIAYHKHYLLNKILSHPLSNKFYVKIVTILRDLMIVELKQRLMRRQEISS